MMIGLFVVVLSLQHIGKGNFNKYIGLDIAVRLPFKWL